MWREILPTVGVAFSMVAGIVVLSFCCINPLAHGPRAAEFSAVVVVLGAVGGAVAWVIGERFWRRP